MHFERPQSLYVNTDMDVTQSWRVFWWWSKSEFLLYFERPFHSHKTP